MLYILCQSRSNNICTVLTGGNLCVHVHTGVLASSCAFCLKYLLHMKTGLSVKLHSQSFLSIYHQTHCNLYCYFNIIDIPHNDIFYTILFQLLQLFIQSLVYI